MAVTAVLVYELHGATRAQYAALSDALALLPGFQRTHLHNTWEIERPHDPRLHSLIEEAFRGIPTIFKIEKANFRIYTARDLRAANSVAGRASTAPRAR